MKGFLVWACLLGAIAVGCDLGTSRAPRYYIYNMGTICESLAQAAVGERSEKAHELYRRICEEPRMDVFGPAIWDEDDCAKWREELKERPHDETLMYLLASSCGGLEASDFPPGNIPCPSLADLAVHFFYLSSEGPEELYKRYCVQDARQACETGWSDYREALDRCDRWLMSTALYEISTAADGDWRVCWQPEQRPCTKPGQDPACSWDVWPTRCGH